MKTVWWILEVWFVHIFICSFAYLLITLNYSSLSAGVQIQCQLLTEGSLFTPRNNLFLQLWKLTTIYNQIWLKNGVKHQFTSPCFNFAILCCRQWILSLPRLHWINAACQFRGKCFWTKTNKGTLHSRWLSTSIAVGLVVCIMIVYLHILYSTLYNKCTWH